MLPHVLRSPIANVETAAATSVVVRVMTIAPAGARVAGGTIVTAHVTVIARATATGCATSVHATSAGGGVTGTTVCVKASRT